MGMGNAGHRWSVMLCLLIFLYFISHFLSPFLGAVGMVVVMFLDPFGGWFSFGGRLLNITTPLSPCFPFPSGICWMHLEPVMP